MSEEKKAPHVYVAIQKVTEKLSKDGIAKDKGGSGDIKYKFRGIDDIRNAIAPIQKECGLIIVPKMISRTEKEGATKSGAFSLRVVIEVDFHFLSTEDGSELVVKMFNESVDYSDKATNKALSQAYKNACLNVFNIPTEGEQDTDEEKHKDLKSTRRTAFASRELCDDFVHRYLVAVSDAKTKQALAELGSIHAVTMESMKISDDEHERMVVGICRTKHTEALDEFRKQEANEAKAGPLKVSAALKGGANG